MVEAVAAGAEVAQYSPNEVKLAVAGDGAADKQAVRLMVQKLLGLAAPPRPADAADAAALALCHLAHAPMRSRVAAATRESLMGPIGSLRGTLAERSPTGEVLVEVSGVGYRVQAGPLTAARLGDVGAEVFVWTHHHVREDAQSLFGFATRDERTCFEALIGAHGVGPALALAILSVHQPDALRRVLADDDVAALCLVPGVGKKTAARLLVELKSRLDLPDGEPVAGGGQRQRRLAGQPAARADVRDALASLGYGADEIADAIRELPDGDDSGVLLKEALRQLASAGR